MDCRLSRRIDSAAFERCVSAEGGNAKRLDFRHVHNLPLLMSGIEYRWHLLSCFETSYTMLASMGVRSQKQSNAKTSAPAKRAIDQIKLPVTNNGYNLSRTKASSVAMSLPQDSNCSVSCYRHDAWEDLIRDWRGLATWNPRWASNLEEIIGGTRHQLWRASIFKHLKNDNLTRQALAKDGVLGRDARLRFRIVSPEHF